MHMWEILSDGAVAADGEGGCAAVVPNGDRVLRLNVVLGQVTTTDAELLGGLFGLWLVCYMGEKGDSVRWKSDSATTISTAAETDKEDSVLWQSFRLASKDLELQCEFLSPQDRDVTHRACDKASRWASESGVKLLEEVGEGPQGRLASLDPSRAWHLIDGRSIAISSVAIDPLWLAEKLSQFSSLKNI